jgi:hypothetical protein
MHVGDLSVKHFPFRKGWSTEPERESEMGHLKTAGICADVDNAVTYMSPYFVKVFYKA